MYLWRIERLKNCLPLKLEVIFLNKLNILKSKVQSLLKLSIAYNVVNILNV